MIPVKPVPEPSSFDANVRVPGRAYLRTVGVQKQGDSVQGKIAWNGVDYWRDCSNELYVGYRQLCCYVAMKINRKEKDGPNVQRSVEHFVPKSKDPWLAYEWTNYRLASRKANSDRGDQDVMDPFKVQQDDFLLNLVNGEIYPNPELSPSRLREVADTIDRIKLNDPYWTNLRRKYCAYYVSNPLLFTQEEKENYLEKQAPIVLAQLKRQSKKQILEED